MDQQTFQKLRLKENQEKYGPDKVMGITEGPADQAEIRGGEYKAQPRAREIMLSHVREAQEIYLRRLGALQKLKEEIDRSSDYELDAIYKFQNLTAQSRGG